MASKQRENARIAKKRAKERKTKKIIWIVLIVIIIILIIMRVCEIDFASLKNKYTDENGKFSISMTADMEAYPFAVDSSNIIKVKPISDKLSVLTDSSLTVLNPADAIITYTVNHGYANPVMSSAGQYICIIDQGSNRLRLDRTTQEIYESKTENPLLCADVSKTGTVIYSTRSDEEKSSVTVMNASLKKVAEFNVNSGYVVSVAIDASGKKCAYATVNSVNAKLVTTVHTFNVGDDKDRASFDYVDSSVMDLHYSDSSNLYYVGTNCVSVISSQKKEKPVFQLGTMNTECFNYTKNNELVIDFTPYAQANENSIAYVTSSGKISTQIDLQKKVKYISSSSNEICVLFSDKVSTYSLTKGKEKESISCDDSLTTADKLSSKVFVTRHQLIDVMG